jgi:hypothetical protein
MFESCSVGEDLLIGGRWLQTRRRGLRMLIALCLRLPVFYSSRGVGRAGCCFPLVKYLPVVPVHEPECHLGNGVLDVVPL